MLYMALVGIVYVGFTSAGSRLTNENPSIEGEQSGA